MEHNELSKIAIMVFVKKDNIGIRAKNAKVENSMEAGELLWKKHGRTFFGYFGGGGRR